MSRPPLNPLCHHCDNPPCCNPAHLWVGTPLQNNDDKVAKGRQSRGRVGVSLYNSLKTQCVRGHPLIEGNVYWSHGGRSCKTCSRERYVAKRLAAGKPVGQQRKVAA